MHLERVLSPHDSVYKNALITKFKIWGQKMCVYIYHFIQLKSHEECSFLFKNKHDCDIHFTQQFNKQ